MEICNFDKLFDIQQGHMAVIATPSVSEKASTLPANRYPDFSALPNNLDTLIVIGGGTLIDQAKLWRHRQAPGVRLIAIPSIWGSGAEVSPVAIIDDKGHKEVHVDFALVPDFACFWPELAESIPPDLARRACGDAWSHAIEGFLSPLASETLQSDLASVTQRMLKLPIANDNRWFELSALACAGQAQSSVGLVHGIAHTLEAYLRQDYRTSDWGHARLCSVFLWPVMEFNRQQSDKWQTLTQKHYIDSDAIFSILKQLHESEAYNQALPLLDEHWLKILKDPCSRTNSSLVRPASKAFFLEHFNS